MLFAIGTPLVWITCEEVRDYRLFELRAAAGYNMCERGEGDTHAPARHPAMHDGGYARGYCCVALFSLIFYVHSVQLLGPCVSRDDSDISLISQKL